MKRVLTHPGRLALAAVALATLAGCGGGSGSAAAPEATPQQNEDRAASASVGGLLAFAQAQIAGHTSDSATPRAVGGITPPQDDSGRPTDL